MYETSTVYKMVKDVVKEKSLLLKDHEKKGFCHAVVPFTDYVIRKIGGKTFCLVPNNVFNLIIHQNLIRAQKKYPERFGNGNARDVIRALYDIEPLKDFDFFVEMLSREQFCYIVEINNDTDINPKVLRLDLYRKIEPNKDGGFDFVGGIFHCFKHFRYMGIPLSTGTDKNELAHPTNLILRIIEAFFVRTLKKKSKDTLISEYALNDSYHLKFVFYYEKETKVYFIKTTYLKNNR